MKIKSKQKNKGFTLIELMVATSVFIVIMLASMSSLFVLLDASKNSRALRSTMDNVSFAMDSMTRSIRMGTNYYCVSSGDIGYLDNLNSTNDCSSTDDGTLIAFKPQGATATSKKVAYKLTQRTDNSNTLQRCDTNGCADIVSPDVNIEKLKFIVKGSSGDYSAQASVYIIMKGTVMVKGVPTSFAIQTMASRRNF